MKKYYKDFYGATASITLNKDGTATLIMRTAGRRFHAMTYKTERGAKIAMGKAGDCWKEVTE